MAQFLDLLQMEAVNNIDGSGFVLLAPLRYESDLLSRVVEVPTGFYTDLASVPRLPLAYWLCGATANEAAVVHDYLYTIQQCSRKTADAVLREASLATGVPGWRAQMMWLGVRMFGASHWH